MVPPERSVQPGWPWLGGACGKRLIDSNDQCADDARSDRYISQNTRSIFPYSEIFLITVPHPRYKRVRDRDQWDTFLQQFDSTRNWSHSGGNGRQISQIKGAGRADVAVG